MAGLDWFSLLLGFHSRRREYLPELYDEYRRHTVKPLFATRAEALSFAREHVDLYVSEQFGTNELFNAKALAFFTLQQRLHECIYAQAAALLPQHADYLEQCQEFSLARKRDLLEGATVPARRFDWRFDRLAQLDFADDPARHRGACTLGFAHSAEQREVIDQLVHQYGTSQTGLGRILLRAHIKKLFREIEADGVAMTNRDVAFRRASNLHGD